MPKRPDTHRLEGESVAAFASAIPSAWSFDTPSQGADYGLDGTVELFDDQDEAEGLGFYAQVKGTRDPDVGRALAVAFAVDTLNYYRKIERPVLLVRYHALAGALYVGWHHRLDDGLRAEGQQTKTIRWTEAHRWTDETAGDLVRDVRRYRAATRAEAWRPVRAHVKVREGGAMTPGRARVLRRILRSYERRHVAYEDVPGPSDAVAQVEIDGEWASVDYGGVSRTRVNLPACLDSREEIRALLDSVTCLVGLTACAAGHVALGAELVAEHIEGALIWSSPQFAPTAVVGARRRWAARVGRRLHPSPVGCRERRRRDRRRPHRIAARRRARHHVPPADHGDAAARDRRRR